MGDYHSALTPALDLGEMERYESNGNLVFAHDLNHGVHPAFRGADAIYAEPSWRDGYEKFKLRAGVTEGDFSSYLTAIRAIIDELRLPTYMVIGKHMLRNLKPEQVCEIKLYGYPAIFGTWNATLEPVSTPKEAMDYVCQRHERILDFCCGYGNLAEIALAHGKKFVCSDLNRKCVYYVATRFMGAS